ncbi:hypothetical protein, partial [Candidatus Magnetobacterium casense]
GRYKHTDAIKKLSDISGGYFLLSPNHNEIAQLGRIISDIVDSRYIVDFDLTLPPGKYTGVVGFNHMGKELTAQKEFTVSTAAAITAPATATGTTPKIERTPVERAFNERTFQVTQSNWSDNRLIVILFMLLGLSAFCNILLALWALKKPKEATTTSAETTTLDDINRKIDAITNKVSEQRPEVLFEEIVYKLNDAGSRITALTAELRNLPTEDVSPFIGRLERELAKIATVTGMVSDRMEAMDAGIKGIAKELVKTNDKLPTVDTSSTERLQQGIKALSKEVAALRDGLSADKYGESFEKLSGRLDRLEAAITETGGSVQQKTVEAIKGLSQLIQTPPDLTSAYAPMIQKVEAALTDIAGEIAQLKDK